MEQKNDSVDAILEELKDRRTDLQAAPDSDAVDDILASLGLARDTPRAPAPVTAQPAPAPAPKPAPAAAQPAPAPAAKPAPQTAPSARAELPEDDQGEFVRTSPDIFSGEKIDRLSHADELIDDEFYKFFTSPMDSEELARRTREEKRCGKKKKHGLFSRRPREEEAEPEDDGMQPLPTGPAPRFDPQPDPRLKDIFADAPAPQAEQPASAPAAATVERIAPAAAELAPAAAQPVPDAAADAAAPAAMPDLAAEKPAAGEAADKAVPAAENTAAAPADANAPAAAGEAETAAADADEDATRAFAAPPRRSLFGGRPADEPQDEEESAADEDAADEDEEDAAADEDAQDEAQEKDDEIEDYDSPSDAATVQADLKSLRTSLSLRLAVTLILAAITVYLSLTPFFTALPTLSVLSPTSEPFFFLLANTVLLLLAMVVNYNTIASGLGSLFSSPSPDLLPSLASLAALLQCGVFLTGAAKFAAAGDTVFAGVAVFGLAANTFGKCITARMVAENFEMASEGFDHAAAYQIADGELLRKVTDGLGEPQPHLLVSRPTALVRGFLRQSFSEHRSDRTAKWLGIAALAGGLCCGGIAFALTKELFTAVSCFAGAVCLAAPLSSTLVGAIPSGLMQSSAAKVGAVVPGPSAVENLKKTNVVLVGARDLFPPATVRLRGIKTFQKERIDLAILYAASILVEGCDTLRDIFLGVVEGKRDMLYPVENLAAEVGYGFMGWIENNRVIVGSREMMTRHDIEIPSMDYEKRFTGEDKQPIYLAVAGRLFGMFLVSYEADAEMSETVQELRRGGISLLVRTSDFNITSALVADCYGISPDSVKVLSGPELAALTPSLSYLPESEGLMTHIGSFSSFIGGLRAACAAASGEHAASVVQTAAVALGIGLSLLLSVTAGLGGLSSLAVLLYQCAWLILTVAVPLMKRY